MNALIKRMRALSDACDADTRSPQEAYLLLARCQRCHQWDVGLGCARMDRRTWVELLITPGRTCDRMPAAK